MAGSVLVELERAELAARERRLAAATAAEARIAVATEEAARIRAGIDAAVDEALATRRREHLERATAQVAAIEAEIAALDARDEGGGERDAAVELVTASVLGEREV